MPSPPQYGLTGNIGSGKTTVAREFARLGIPVYFADDAAKRLMQEDEQLKGDLVEAFGPQTYTADGKLNRAWLAEKAFNNEEALARLNALVHPAVHRDAAAWKVSQQGVPYTLYEAAIILELGRQKDFTGIIVVAAPESERQKRVVARDQVSEAQFAARAAKQWSDTKKESAADFIVNNDGRQLLLPQVLSLHRRICQSIQ